MNTNVYQGIERMATELKEVYLTVAREQWESDINLKMFACPLKAKKFCDTANEYNKTFPYGWTDLKEKYEWELAHPAGEDAACPGRDFIILKFKVIE